MNYRNDAIQKVRDIINSECIVRVPIGSKELPAMGGRGFYTWQFYLRRAVLDPFCLKVICDDFWSKNEVEFKERPFQITGVESASLPIITALVMDGARRGLQVNAFTIRKERKAYGLRNLIEGIPTSLPVYFIDDLTSSQHNAFWHAIHAISEAGLKLNGLGYVLVLKKKASESCIIETSLGRIIMDSLFTLSDFSMTLDQYNAEQASRSV